MMDTSEKYIEMCRKATKIQDSWKLNDGDYLYYPDINEVVRWLMCDDNLPRMPRDSIWLPQQNRLQEMVTSETKFYLLSLNEFLHKSERGDIYFYSWEQLWLGFVMYKEFGKRWNGSEWEMI